MPETVTPLGPQPPDRLAPLEPSESNYPPASLSQPAPSPLRMSPHLPDPVPPVATASHDPPHSQARRQAPRQRSPAGYSPPESASESVPISRREPSALRSPAFAAITRMRAVRESPRPPAERRSPRRLPTLSLAPGAKPYSTPRSPSASAHPKSAAADRHRER